VDSILQLLRGAGGRGVHALSAGTEGNPRLLAGCRDKVRRLYEASTLTPIGIGE
jgi:hypothetical protein